jgi:hypothetical protein
MKIEHSAIVKMMKLAGIGSFFVLFLLGSCSDKVSTMGDYLVSPNTRTVKIDTFSVNLSVLAKDSVVSSGKGVIYAGAYNDPLIGKSTARSFVEFNKTTGSESDEYPRFDSVTLVLHPTGSYYGDTLVLPSFKISELVKPIELDDDGVRYSTSSVPVGNVLANKEIKIKVGAHQEVGIRLPDEFGKKLFSGIIDDKIEYNTDNYLKTFPGLAIEQSNATEACIYGFSANDTACVVRIHYHVTGGTDVIYKTMDFKANTSKQFNQFQEILNVGSNLPTTSKDDPVSTGKTNNMGFVMTGGIPLYTRLDFPSINELLIYGEIVLIEKARLIVRPVRHSYDVVPLPPQLYLYEHNPTNDWMGNALSVQVSSSVSYLNGNLAGKNQAVHEEYYYDYDLTTFISSQLGAIGYDKIALRIDITSPVSTAADLFQRVVFGDQNFFYKSEAQSKDNQIMLEITYSIYNEY